MKSSIIIHKINNLELFNPLMCRNIRLFVMLLSFILMSATIAYAKSKPAEATDKSDRVHVEKYAAFVMDLRSGIVLHSENENKKLHPASLTKMMTLLMVFDAMDRGRLKRHHRIKISEHAASMIPSKLDLPVGSSIKVKDAIQALATKSANDIAVAVAEKLGNTEKNFARLMTKKARSIGMKRTTFRNASGLHDVRQVSTARDMAILAKTLLTKYKRHYHYFSKDSFTYAGKTYKSHNKLMNSYEGMDGLKTGYIRASGFNLASSVKRGDNRLIGVVFGGKTGTLRNAQMREILDQPFSKIQTSNITKHKIPHPFKKPSKANKKDLPNIITVTKPRTHSRPNASNDNISERYARQSILNQARWSLLTQSDNSGALQKMMAQGDYDPAIRSKIEAGMIAISAHLKQDIPTHIFADASGTQTASLKKPTRNIANHHGEWSIQVGAFTSRGRTNSALSSTLKKLPNTFKHGQGTIAPLETDSGWIFRARISGYSKPAAYEACDMLSDCIPIAPGQAY